MNSDDRGLVTVDATDIRAEPIKRGDPNLGAKMAALGLGSNGGRRRIADKYRPQIEAAEQKFADAMPEAVDEYTTELKAKDPEQCPTHKRTLACPLCSYSSQRTTYNHTAAMYVFDRIMGRPTSRSENTITIKLYQQLSVLFVEAFQAVNEIADPNERKLAYAERLEVIEQQYGGHGGS